MICRWARAGPSNLNGVGDAILGGWTGNLIAYLSTGIPIATPVVGAPIAYFNQRPDLTCDPSKRRAAHRGHMVQLQLLLDSVEPICCRQRACISRPCTHHGRAGFRHLALQAFEFWAMRRISGSRFPPTTSPTAHNWGCLQCRRLPMCRASHRWRRHSGKLLPRSTRHANFSLGHDSRSDLRI